MFSVKSFLFQAVSLWTLTAGQTCSDLNLTIYQDPADIISYQYKTGNYMACPAESQYYEYHPKVFGGYKGCVSEAGFYPCAQDNGGITNPYLYNKTLFNWNGTACLPTGYALENRTFNIGGGNPLDKFELAKRTGLNPTVSFPLVSGPYPSYSLGAGESTFDDTSSAKQKAYDLLTYMGGFKEADRSKWYVGWTEGAEQGIVFTIAGMALSIAQTTCNRNIFIFNEVPSYGHSISEAAVWVNRQNSSFYNSTECTCFANNSCKQPIVILSYVGWFPGNPLPVRTGGDGLNYTADSNSLASPWMETLVYPENPSGLLKTPVLPRASRRVCDGCYMWNMYMGANNFSYDGLTLPDCSSWAFAITKAVSASIRAGFVLFKKEGAGTNGTFPTAFTTVMNTQTSLVYGSYSQWSWMGQVQYWDIMMSRPWTDPTSWIGAYTVLMKEKWKALDDGFKDCPVVRLTNNNQNAYAFFVHKPAYQGIQLSTSGGNSLLWQQVLGVLSPTYFGTFKGADPKTYAPYEGAGTYDFTRVNLYRDVSVYKEIGRRAKIVCSNLDAKIGDFISVNQYVAANKKTTRALREKLEDPSHTMHHSKMMIMENHPDFTEAQAHRMAHSLHKSFEFDKIHDAECAPDFSMSCRVMVERKYGFGDF